METTFNEALRNAGYEFSNNHFENFRKSTTTTMAYLIGVPEEIISVEERFDLRVYESLKSNESANIIRCLCKLRTQFLNNYKSIYDAVRYQMSPLETLTDYLDVHAIKYLRQRGIEINITNAKTPTVNIAYINQYILDNIDEIRSLIPEWIEFKYIKSLFLMPGGYSGHNGVNIKSDYQKIYNAIYAVGRNYASQKNEYPFQMYINWPKLFGETDGNILYNDLKFLKLLYIAHNDSFQATKYVVDAKEENKEEIYDFLDSATNVAIFVDCENVDPYAFGATILNLDDDELSKITKIVLYDDVHTATAWEYIANITKIPVEKVDVERVLDQKSLVDITMTAGVSKEHFKNDIESIILASSDSDFWGLIKALPSASFLVLNEFKKTSNAIIEQLDRHKIQHCYMDNFAQDKIQEFKSDVLYFGLAERIKDFNETGFFETVNVAELLQELFYDANISGAENQIEKEKEVFFKKYIKKGFVIKPVTEEGILKLQIELPKK